MLATIGARLGTFGATFGALLVGFGSGSFYPMYCSLLAAWWYLQNFWVMRDEA